MDFWGNCLEAHPVLIDAAEHDRQLAWTSHLPQAVASALAATLRDSELAGATFGSGAREATRLAAGAPALWTEIFFQNAEALDGALQGMEGRLARLRELVAAGDRAALQQFLTEAAAFHRRLPA
jgi:prephenate dehydrogenase